MASFARMRGPGVRTALTRALRLPVQTPRTARDVEPWILEIAQKVGPWTMTPRDRVIALCQAIEYIENAGVPGAFVECGVAKGGSLMAMALTLQHLGAERDLYGFDTYEGQSEPTLEDRDLFSPDVPIDSLMAASREGQADPTSKFYAPLDLVRQVMASTGYERVQYVKGKVEDTLPGEAPNQIALLRLDTDFYESTRVELEHLYPRLKTGGVLIIDDYGQYAGSRQATDEYFNGKLLLARIDEVARIAVKR